MAPTSSKASSVCQRAREQISAQLDGELDQTGKIRLRFHLATCDDCRRFRSELVSITVRLRGAEPETVRAYSHPRRWAHLNLTASAAATLAVAGLIAVVLVNPTRNHNRPILTSPTFQWHGDQTAYDHTTHMA
jgi:predicted anti-sigma-YlaC factor YlaD